MPRPRLCNLNTPDMQIYCIFFVVSFLCTFARITARYEAEPGPPVWPETFHASALQNRSGSLALVDLYYEWGKGRNANLIHKQLGTTLYDIE